MKKTRSNLPVAEVHRLINHVQKFPQDSANQRDKILRTFENLIHSIVKKYRQSTAEDYRDFFQAGVVGLFIAVEKFDGSRKVKFITFATKTITGYVLKYLTSETKHYINPYLSRYVPTETIGGGEVSPIEQIADSRFDDSFENKSISHIDSENFQPKLNCAVKTLPQRQRQAVELFFYEDNPKSEIAKRLKVSRPRVNALLNDAIDGLRRRLQIAV